MNQPDLLAALAPVVEAFDTLGVAYSIVGSVASSAHGVARSTLDADLVVDLKADQVAGLVTQLEHDYYVDLDAARDAVSRRAMFNVIHLATMVKVDIYVLTRREFDQTSFGRRTTRAMPDEPGARVFHLDTAEDTVLHKLEWYRAGGEVSDRQWSDITGVLQVQHDALDFAYLDRWAAELGVVDLLARARRDAGEPG